MKKFSKLLLVILAVALLAMTVFSTLGSAATASAEETALIGKANTLGINRKVEDFTGENILIKDNIVPGEAYAESASDNTVKDLIVRDAGTNKYGALATVDSKTGNRYVRLSYEKAYAASGSTYRSGIGINDKQTFANNDYLIYEWDMTTETQYPANFAAIFLNTSSTSIGDKQTIFSFNADGTKLVVGETEYDLGAAGTWHHFTVVISLIADGTDYRGSLGAIFLDGVKVGDFTPVVNKARKHSLRLLLGYYDQERETAANSTVCVDNIVSTTVPKGYKDGENKLGQIFADTNPLTDLKLFGSDEIVYNTNYTVPFEPQYATYQADGSLAFYPSFAEAYTAYKAGGAQWVEVYENTEAAVDAPVVIKTAGAVTFTDTNAGADNAYTCVEATGADGSIYKTYTNSTETLTVLFFNGRKGTEDALTAQLELPFAIGVIPTVPEEFAPVQFSANPDNLSKVFEVTDGVEIYVDGVLQSEMPLVREAMITAGTVVSVYPVYTLQDVAFEVAAPEEKVQYYTQGSQLADAVKNASDGAVVTVRKNLGITSKLKIEDKALTIDLAGKALYQGGASAFVTFDVENATLNLYSSAEGGVVYCGKDSAADTMLAITGDGTSVVRIGFVDDNAKDAYAGNLTVHTPTVAKVSAQATVTIAGAVVKVVNAAYATEGVVELNGASCRNTTVTLENVEVYNSYIENNVIAYASAGDNNTVTMKDTVIYAPAKTEANGKGLINIVGTISNAAKQSVVLNNFTYYGTLTGAAVGANGVITLTVAGTVEAVAVDTETLNYPEGTLFVKNNKSVEGDLKYVAGGAFANWLNPINGSKTPALLVQAATGKTEADFCKVTWFFYEGAGVVEEYWARGVVPVFTGATPVSPENITYTFEDVVIEVIGADATELTIEATELAELDKLGLKQNVAIIAGMDLKIYIPANIPLTSVVVGDITITDLIPNEDGYYVVTIGQFTLETLATAEFAFKLNLTTARGTELYVESVANVLDYFASVYEDETLKIVEQRMVTAYLKYAQSAGQYLGYDTTAIAELIAGKVTNYYLIDGLADTGVLRNAVVGVRMSLVEIPTFVFYLRETFSGTVTVGGTEYTVVNGVANEKNYILYTPASYAELGKEITFTIAGTLAGAEVNGTGAFTLTNYLMGVREELGTTPTYILDLYQFFAVAKIVEEMRAEEDVMG